MGAYLVVEQLAEPTEHCRENRVSTKDPHEKDSPGALPTKTPNKSPSGHSPRTFLLRPVQAWRPVKGPGFSQTVTFL